LRQKHSDEPRRVNLSLNLTLLKFKIKKSGRKQLIWAGAGIFVLTIILYPLAQSIIQGGKGQDGSSILSDTAEGRLKTPMPTK
jgi:hypothetical protein